MPIILANGKQSFWYAMPPSIKIGKLDPMQIY
jgi:hypothetical protein